jgi:hypothetical protein
MVAIGRSPIALSHRGVIDYDTFCKIRDCHDRKA